MEILWFRLIGVSEFGVVLLFSVKRTNDGQDRELGS